MIEFELRGSSRTFAILRTTFALNEMRPVAAEHDREGTWPGNVLAKAWELGLCSSAESRLAHR